MLQAPASATNKTVTSSVCSGRRVANSVRHRRIASLAALTSLVVGLTGSPQLSQGKPLTSPDILVLGDSQLSFGAGAELLAFFKTIAERCARSVANGSVLADVQRARITLIGTRSTSLQSWVTTKGAAWRQMCRKDPKWGVNASIWGHLKPAKRTYVQIGEEPHFQFCHRGETPLQALFRREGYEPKLVVFNLLGNGASRWANSPSAAVRDAKALADQLPPSVRCVYMTTMPHYKAKYNRTRLRAQRNIETAFSDQGGRCTFVRGLSPQTIQAVQGNQRFFRTRKSGTVKDPFHPNKAATRKVLALNGPALCRAIATEFGKGMVATKAREPSSKPM
ncbi:MAG: SGNH/GDSL hydrolase family protein [Pseudomonadota bacterium]